MSSDSEPEHLATGREAEERAVALLRARGCVVLDRNYRTPRGELDIVARDGEYVVFVEVRARRSEAFGEPVLSVGSAKRAAVARAARAWLSAHGLDDHPIRFDIVTFTGENFENVEVYPNAFGVDDPWA
jgi:putative endonuclease